MLPHTSAAPSAWRSRMTDTELLDTLEKWLLSGSGERLVSTFDVKFAHGLRQAIMSLDTQTAEERQATVREAQ